MEFHQGSVPGEKIKVAKPAPPLAWEVRLIKLVKAILFREAEVPALVFKKMLKADMAEFWGFA